MLVSKIIGRALRLLGVIDASQPVAPGDAQTAIVALNSMVSRWEANGLALGWANVAHVTDTMPCPDEAEDAISYNLAVRLAPEYGKPVRPDVGQLSMDFLAELRRDRLTEMPLQLSSDLPRSGGHYNIYTDEYV